MIVDDPDRVVHRSTGRARKAYLGACSPAGVSTLSAAAPARVYAAAVALSGLEAVDPMGPLVVHSEALMGEQQTK